jgi:hypothetical protein
VSEGNEMYDIIPDIHGQAGKLKGALTSLGYVHKNGAWRHSDPKRTCVFLGDFIDRGPDNEAVIDIVRRMVDADTASAIMGNHELNAIHFHTRDPKSGEPVRAHSAKNFKQHASFLKEFPLGDPKTSEAISWMMSLPLFNEFDTFRVVHACWNDTVIDEFLKITKKGQMTDEQFLLAADKNNQLFSLVETTTKGPEAMLPDDYLIYDKEGHGRSEVRLQWWNGSASTWKEIATSVPNLDQLPDSNLPASIKQSVYPLQSKPVFFGHYWLTGKPVLQAKNALCLDYSAGRDGPLVSYQFDPKITSLDLKNLTTHS